MDLRHETNASVPGERPSVRFDWRMASCAEADASRFGRTRRVNRTGNDEQIKVELSRVPAGIEQVALPCDPRGREPSPESWHGVERFHLLRRRGKRSINHPLRPERGRLDRNLMIFNEVYRAGADWRFRAVGQGFKGGLDSLARNYGVSVG
jgi:tellurium resistance protein TerD